jgi:hypothetical protein
MNNDMAFNTNNFMQSSNSALPDRMFDSSFAQQQHDALMRYRQQLQHQQQQRFYNFWSKPQPGGSQHAQPGSIRQFYQQPQQNARVFVRTSPLGGVWKPQLGGIRATRPPVKLAQCALTEARRRNEIAERVRIEQEQHLERKKHAKRKAELKKDPSANYRRYKEYLEYFPLARGEHANEYLLGLLANQQMPAEPTSDMGLAIQYAKKHWENSWEMKDLEHVVVMAKEEVEKKN